VAAITTKTELKSAWRKPTRRRVRTVRDRLREVYGIPRMAPHGDPIAELVLTVLSQSTNDRNRDVAYLELRARFPSWEAVMGAPVGEIEQAIRGGGISKVKSARIKATRTTSNEIINHALSMLTFVIALIEFITLKGFATSPFFFIMVMTLFDVIAGYTISIVAAEHDLGLGRAGTD